MSAIVFCPTSTVFLLVETLTLREWMGFFFLVEDDERRRSRYLKVCTSILGARVVRELSNQKQAAVEVRIGSKICNLVFKLDSILFGNDRPRISFYWTKRWSQGHDGHRVIVTPYCFILPSMIGQKDERRKKIRFSIEEIKWKKTEKVRDKTRVS